MDTARPRPPVADQAWAALAAEVRRSIARRVGDSAVVDDLVQDVFVRVQSRRGQLRADEQLGAWVGAITRSIVADHYRRSRPTGPLPDSVADEVADEVVSTQCLARWIAASLQTLDPKHRAVLELTEMQGLTQRAAAERLGLSLTAVKSRVLRGRAKLEARLHACCEIELDRRGGVVDYSRRCGDCCE